MTDDMSQQPPVDVEKSTHEELSKLAKLKTALPSEKPRKNPKPTESKETSTAKSKEDTPPPRVPPPPSSTTVPPDKPIKTVLAAEQPPTKKPKEEDEALKLSSDAYNGSKTEKYVWAQTISDIDIRVPIPKGTTGKDLKVDIRIDSLKVEVLRPSREVCELIDAELWPVHMYMGMVLVYMYMYV